MANARDFANSAAVTQVQHGIPLSEVQQQLGHARIDSTTIYTKLPTPSGDDWLTGCRGERHGTSCTVDVIGESDTLKCYEHDTVGRKVGRGRRATGGRRCAFGGSQQVCDFPWRMALKLASGAVRLAPARVDNLDCSIDNLGGYTIGQLGGLEATKGHDPSEMLDAPWHPDEALKHALQVVADVEHELDLAPNALYEASRYADRWLRGAVAPHTRFTLHHAQRVVAAMCQFIELCDNRLET